MSEMKSIKDGVNSRLEIAEGNIGEQYFHSNQTLQNETEQK
jgi:hypothetical protein